MEIYQPGRSTNMYVVMQGDGKSLIMRRHSEGEYSRSVMPVWDVVDETVDHLMMSDLVGIMNVANRLHEPSKMKCEYFLDGLQSYFVRRSGEPKCPEIKDYIKNNWFSANLYLAFGIQEDICLNDTYVKMVNFSFDGEPFLMKYDVDCRSIGKPVRRPGYYVPDTGKQKEVHMNLNRFMKTCIRNKDKINNMFIAR